VFWFVALFVVVPLMLMGIASWARGTIHGAIFGFIPIELICFFVAYADTNSQPTKITSFYAFWVGAGITILPALIAQARRKQSVSQK